MKEIIVKSDDVSKHVKTLKIIQSEVQSINKVALSVDCVIFGFDENKLKVLLIRSDLKKFQSRWSLLGCEASQPGADGAARPAALAASAA